MEINQADLGAEVKQDARQPIAATYGASWTPTVFIWAIAAFIPFIVSPMLMPLLGTPGYRLVIPHGISATLLACLLLMQRWTVSENLRVIGAVTPRSLLAGMGAILMAYILCYALTFAMGLPRETAMVTLFSGLSAFEVAGLLLALLVLPPLSEELLFRHFLLSLVPFKKNRLWACAGTLWTAVIFMQMHSYQHEPTKALMFACGVILAVARIRSGGLALPVLLHSFAILLGLFINWLWQIAGG